MDKFCSIIYANRDRDPERITKSLQSLQEQKSRNFEVIFVDYGSNADLVKSYRKLMRQFPFVKFFSLEVSQLLWNKSKALNYGILKAETPYLFIADVDLIFHPDSTTIFEKLSSRESFFLFRLGYLSKKSSANLSGFLDFQKVTPARVGSVNGMILASKKSLMEVNGLDEFFHFYGAEDEDLFARLENAGYNRKQESEQIIYHNWHPGYASSQDNSLSIKPRIKNAIRINQRHFEWNKALKVIKPIGQSAMGEVVSSSCSSLLKTPHESIEMPNILAFVEHFLKEELPAKKGKIVEVKFVEDPYSNSFKHRIKKLIGRQSQPYIPMKDLNDMILKEIVFKYRNHNYSFHISEDLKIITFCIEL